MTETQRTLLIVDDTPANIDLLKGILGPHYTIKVATNGPLALKLADRPPRPDLILLDIMMPGMDGYEVCQTLKSRESTRDIPVIFVTARNQEADEARGFELGAADYLTKPISAPIVLARVRTHLRLADERLLLADLVRERTQQLEHLQMELIMQLGRAAEFRDNETSAHTLRMAELARLLGQRAGLDAAQCEHLRYAAMLHDVGKIGVADTLLFKPGKLSEDEFAEMKRHCEIGAKIIGNHEAEVLRMAREIALTHHERWDGTGYPHGLQGKAIPLVGRISALADVFDALTSQRPYKKAWSIDDALAYIQQHAGTHFDPELTQLFLALEPDLRRIKSTYKDEDE